MQLELYGWKLNMGNAEQKSHTEPDRPSDLSLCGNRDCGSDWVYPVEWHEVADTDEWEMYLRCPHCEWTDTVVADQASADRFDEKLTKAQIEISQSLRRMMQNNFAVEIKNFAHALQAGGILPEDF